MAVMMVFCYMRLKGSSPLYQKIIVVILTILQGYSRIALNYHTIEQVIAGIAYGLIYAAIFDYIWSNYIGPILQDKYDEWFGSREEKNA